MKKYILYPVIALLTVLHLTACNDDDNETAVTVSIGDIAVVTTSTTARISIWQPGVVENGESRQIVSLAVRYSAADANEWQTQQAEAMSDDIYTVDLDGLQPSTLYEYIVCITTDTGMQLDKTRQFSTLDIVIEATFSDVKLNLSNTGLRLSVKSVTASVDGQPGTIDGCGAQYRAEGASAWKSVTGEMNDTEGFAVAIPGDDLTIDTVYEVRAWVEICGVKTYSQTCKRTYEISELQNIIGEWCLDRWHDSEEIPFAIYLSIGDEGTFTLWQQLQSVEWQKFTGTLSLDNNIVSGVYSDGESWSTSYYVDCDGDEMIWTATTDAGDVSVYVPAEIPADLQIMRVKAEKKGATERFL